MLHFSGCSRVRARIVWAVGGSCNAECKCNCMYQRNSGIKQDQTELTTSEES